MGTQRSDDHEECVAAPSSSSSSGYDRRVTIMPCISHYLYGDIISDAFYKEKIYASEIYWQTAYIPTAGQTEQPRVSV